ncbi:hypothetical protein HDU76_012986 [Blyttiomyces sp. JEL0837]|nr:hypothetical protein HDU76_012986 [Blyttiomyces sp. JEL0837]
MARGATTAATTTGAAAVDISTTTVKANRWIEPDDALLASLPKSTSDLDSIIQNMSYKKRNSYASKLALKFKNDPKIKPLIWDLLKTESLGSTITVMKSQKKNDKKSDGDAAGNPMSVVKSVDDAAEWDIVADTEEVKLLVEQTNAAKNLPLRCFGIIMACIVQDKDILESIVRHPSETMKIRAKKSLAVAKGEAFEDDDDEDGTTKKKAKLVNHEELFERFCEAIRNPDGITSTVKIVDGKTFGKFTRQQLWDQVKPDVYTEVYRAFHTNLKPMSQEKSKQFVKTLFQLFEKYPPLKQGKPPTSKSRPYFPTLFNENLSYLLRADMKNTIRIYMECNRVYEDENESTDTTTTAAATKRQQINVDILLRNMDNLRPRYDDPECVANMLDSLQPIFENFDILSRRSNGELGGTGITNGLTLELLLEAPLVTHVLIYLIEEAFVVLERVLDTKVITDENGIVVVGGINVDAEVVANESLTKKKERQRQKFVRDVTNSLKYIFNILNVLYFRLSKVTVNSEKKPAQMMFEEKFDGVLKRLLLEFIHKIERAPIFLEMGKEARQIAIVELQVVNILKPALGKCSGFKCAYLLAPFMRSFQHVLGNLDFVENPKEELMKDGGSGAGSGAVSRTKEEERVLQYVKDIATELLSTFKPPAKVAVSEYKPAHRLEAPYNGSPGWTNDMAVAAVLEKFKPVDHLRFWSELAKRGFLTEKDREKVVEMIGKDNLAAILKGLIKYTDVVTDVLDYLIVDVGECYRYVEGLLQTLKETDVSIQRRLNEMRLDMDSLMLTIWRTRSRRYLEEVTVEEAKLLAQAYTTLDMNNLSAVSVSPQVKNFIAGLSNDAINFYCNDPEHPLFVFAIETRWRHAIHDFGTKQAADRVQINISNPSRVDDAMEIQYRRSLWSAVRISRENNAISEMEAEKMVDMKLNTLGRKAENIKENYGCFRIDEGTEDAVVTGIYNLMEGKFKSIAENAEKSFMDSPCGKSLMDALTRALGYRWPKSTILKQYFDKCLGVLADAPALDGPVAAVEKVLNWSKEPQTAALAFMQSTFVCWSFRELNTDWYKKFTDLKLQSSLASIEANRRFNNDQDIERQNTVVELCMKLSPGGSALHVESICEFILTYRPDLLTAKHFSHRKGFIGLFNPDDEEKQVLFQLDNKSEMVPLPADYLLPWQEDLLRKRYLEEALDSAVSMAKRVLAASRMMMMKSTSVHDIAAFLLTPSLPQRIMEAVLMFIPNIDEPGAAGNLLLAPVFMDSDLVRTAIFAVKNILTSMSDSNVEKTLKSLVPKQGERFSISAFKEVVRLLAANASVGSIMSTLRELWYREKLHPDVRIVLVQSILPLLSDKNTKIAETAWEMAVDCVNSDKINPAGAVLLLVNLAPEPPLTFFKDVERSISTFTPRVFFFSYAELVQNTIPYAIRDRYLFDILIPMGTRLWEMFKAMKSTSEKDYNLIKMMLERSFMIIHEKWADYCDSHKLTLALKSRAVTLAQLAGSEDVEDSSQSCNLFFNTMLALTMCASRGGVSDETDSTPESWKVIVEAVRLVLSKQFDETASIQDRLNAQSLLGMFDFMSVWLPTAAMKSVQFKQQAMNLFDDMTSVPGVAAAFGVVQWQRRVSYLKIEAGEIKKAIDVNKTTRGPDETVQAAKLEQRTVKAFENAEELTRQIIKLACSAPVNGSPLVNLLTHLFEPKSAVANLNGLSGFECKLFDSDDWCKSVPEFAGIRNHVKLAMLEKRSHHLMTGTRVAKFVVSLAKNDVKFFKAKSVVICSVFVEVLDILKNSLSELTRWEKRQATEGGASKTKKPVHDAEGLEAMLAALNEIHNMSLAETTTTTTLKDDDDNEVTSLSRVMLKIVSGQTLFLLEKSPATALAVIETSLKVYNDTPFKTWFKHVNYNAIFTEKARDLAAMERGLSLPSIKPLLEKISADALTCKFDSKADATRLFTDYASLSLPLMIHVSPTVIRDYILQNPDSRLATNFQNDFLLNVLGADALSVYYDAVVYGWAGKLDWEGISKKLGLSSSKSEPLFEMTFECVGKGKRWVQTGESKTRRGGFVSVDAVSRAFVNLVSAMKDVVTTDGISQLQSRTVSVWNPSSSMPLSPDGIKNLRKIAVSGNVQARFTNASLFLTYIVDSLTQITNVVDVFTVATPTPIKLENLYTYLATVKSIREGQPERRSASFAFPIKVLLDIIGIITRVIAPYLEGQGLYHAAAKARTVAVNCLQNVHSTTQNCVFNEERSGQVKVNAEQWHVLDALMLEAAEEVKGGGDGGEVRMVVRGFEELVRELAMSADSEVLKVAMALQASKWKLSWVVKKEEN